MPILHLYNPSAKDIGFSILVQYLLQKEKVLLSLGEIKYTSNSFKDNIKPYIKKDDKLVHMVDKPPSPPKIQRFNTTREIS